MPRIPILQKPGLLADAPRPVLDTQRRPTVDRSGEMRALQGVADASKMPEVDAAAMTAPMRALGAVGEAVHRTGSLMGALALKQAEAETTIQVAKADQMMQDGFNKHLEFRDKNPDPRTWEKDLQEKLAESRKAIDGTKGLRMAAKEQIDLRYAMFSGKSLADTKTAGAKETFNQAKSVLDGQIMDAMRDEKWDESVDLTQQKVDAGYGYPHEVAAQKTRVKEMKEQAEKRQYADKVGDAQDVVHNDPWAADENFEILAKDLKPTEQDQMRVEIERAKQVKQTEGISDLANAMARGEFQSEAALEAAFPKRMDDVTRQKFLHNWRVMQVPKNKQALQDNAGMNFARFSDAVEAYDPEEDPKGQRFTQLYLAIQNGLPTGMNTDMLGELKKKGPGVLRDLESTNVVRTSIREDINNKYQAGGFGDYEHRKIELAPETPEKRKERQDDGKDPKYRMVPYTDQAKKEKALKKKGDLMFHMDQWLKENPGAGMEEARKEMEAATRGEAPLYPLHAEHGERPAVTCDSEDQQQEQPEDISLCGTADEGRQPGAVGSGD